MKRRDDIHEDLKATSDSIRHDAQLLVEIEEEKLELDPSDPRVDVLSTQVEHLVSDISDKAKAESELADADNGDAEEGRQN